MLAVGIISARAVNLRNVACERGFSGVEIASTDRRHPRFVQPVRLPQDRAAPLIVGPAGGAERRTLVLDRGN